MSGRAEPDFKDIGLRLSMSEVEVRACYVAFLVCSSCLNIAHMHTRMHTQARARMCAHAHVRMHTRLQAYDIDGSGALDGEELIQALHGCDVECTSDDPAMLQVYMATAYIVMAWLRVQVCHRRSRMLQANALLDTWRSLPSTCCHPCCHPAVGS